MIKSLELENFWNFEFLKTKKHSVNKIAKQTENTAKFFLAVGLISLNTLLLMSYVYGVNHFASTGYEIKALQTRLSALNEDNSKINLKVSEANSMVAIQSGFLSANFVPVGTPKFLIVPQAAQLTLK